MIAYKVFWDTSSSTFTYETEPSDVHSDLQGCDSTTVWLDTLVHASDLAKLRNDKVETGLLFVRECKDCGTPFMMDSDDHNWFIDNGLKLPVRCYKCRQKCKKK